MNILSFEETKAIVVYPEKLEEKFNFLIQNYFTKSEINTIKETVNYIKDKHLGQFRKESTPYYTHCLLVAINFMNYEISTVEDILVCLLHDVIEDNPYTKIEEIAGKYGNYVAESVLGLSKIRNGIKITDVDYYSYIQNNENIAKYKGYDRLSNLYSLYYATEWNKRDKYIIETEEKILPILDNFNLDVANKIREILGYLRLHPTLTVSEVARIQELKLQKNQL